MSTYNNESVCPICNRVRDPVNGRCPSCDVTLAKDQTVVNDETRSATVCVDSQMEPKNTEATLCVDSTMDGQMESQKTEETLRQEGGSLIGVVFGRCKVLEKLGQGGMGTVYKAYHQTLDQTVVLKALPAHLATSSQFRDRFMREARSCAKLYHQNVVQVLDAGYEHSVYFYIMEFVDGASLEAMMLEGHKFSDTEACRIIRDTAIGLEVAHQQGIIHRDIKASNIMLTQSGTVKVADFGLAYDLGAERISMMGQMLGTPHYMSPEQWEGSNVDGRSDLYSLGVTFYYLLAGHLPFEGSTPAVILKKHTMEPPQPLRKLRANIAPALEHIVMRLLEKKPEDRYPDAGALIRDLDNLLSGRSPEFFKAHRRRVLVCSAAILLLLGGLGAGVAKFWPRIRQIVSGMPASVIAQNDPPIPVKPNGNANPDNSRPQPQPPVVQPQPPVVQPQPVKPIVNGGDKPKVPNNPQPTVTPPKIPEKPVTRPKILVPAGMIVIPGGNYVLHERPVVVQPFYLDRTEVTNEAYERYLQASGAMPPMRWLAKEQRSAEWNRQPVVFVSHQEAVAYARFYGKRLPTEAEWTVAALADRQRLQDYPWGNSADNLDWPKRVLQVGSWAKDKSPAGVVDMASNVSEWVAETLGDKAMRKGGYYQLKPLALQRLKWASVNFLEPQESRNNWLGFRCAWRETE